MAFIENPTESDVMYCQIGQEASEHLLGQLLSDVYDACSRTAQAEGPEVEAAQQLVRSPARRPASDRGGQHRCSTHGGAEPHPDPLGVQQSVGAGATGAGGCGATARQVF